MNCFATYVNDFIEIGFATHSNDLIKTGQLENGFATVFIYLKKDDLIDDTVNVSLHWLRYSLAYTASRNHLFTYTAIMMLCHLLAIVWSTTRSCASL